jgi:hypothetical protein
VAIQTSAADIARSWIQIVRGEFLEIPGLLLTRSQVEHLWGLERDLCDEVLHGLIESRFLERTPSGAFVHVDAIRH